MHWDQLSRLAKQPLDALRQAYSWGGDFRGDDALRSIGLLVQAFGGHAGMYAADRDLVRQYYAPDAVPASGLSNLIIAVPQRAEDVLGDGILDQYRCRPAGHPRSRPRRRLRPRPTAWL